MSGKNAVINFNKCDTSQCFKGICAAIKTCEKRVIKQEKPHEPPYINPDLCTGCYKCIGACPLEAIEKSK